MIKRDGIAEQLVAYTRMANEYEPRVCTYLPTLFLAKQPRDQKQALSWLRRSSLHRYTVSIGLMQVNADMAPQLQVRQEQLLEPCTNVRVGATILTAVYTQLAREMGEGMRGYGQTQRPEEIDQYTLLHLVGDMVGLLDTLGADAAVIAGHDWGAPVAWYAALLRPDRFRGVIGLSVPFTPRRPARPTTTMPQTDDGIFYQLYFQSPGIAEAEFERDVRLTVRSLLYSASGDATRRENRTAAAGEVGMVPRQGGFLSRLINPVSLPQWLTEADVDFYVGEFTRTGFRGGLNWYRNIDRNWELLGPMAGVRVTVPALYIAGDHDLVLAFRGMDQIIANLSKFVPQLRRTLLLPGCGHWTQQERAPEVDEAMIDFLRRI